MKIASVGVGGISINNIFTPFLIKIDASDLLAQV
jgi:hypothetical protein